MFNLIEFIKQKKKIAWIIVVALTIIWWMETGASFFLYREQTHHVKINGTFLPEAQPIHDFKLMATNGQPFTKNNLKGHWTLLFFGFTNCGMVCPATLATLADMYRILEKDLSADELPQVVLISVDPDRDTIPRMQAYVKSFHPAFIGARTGAAETVALEKQFHIAAAKMQAGAQYTINHSTEILLINPDAEIQAYLSYPHNAEQMAKDYQLVINNVTNEN